MERSARRMRIWGLTRSRQRRYVNAVEKDSSTRAIDTALPTMWRRSLASEPGPRGDDAESGTWQSTEPLELRTAFRRALRRPRAGRRWARRFSPADSWSGQGAQELQQHLVERVRLLHRRVVCSACDHLAPPLLHGGGQTHAH